MHVLLNKQLYILQIQINLRFLKVLSIVLVKCSQKMLNDFVGFLFYSMVLYCVLLYCIALYCIVSGICFFLIFVVSLIVILQNPSNVVSIPSFFPFKVGCMLFISVRHISLSVDSSHAFTFLFSNCPISYQNIVKFHLKMN